MNRAAIFAIVSTASLFVTLPALADASDQSQPVQLSVEGDKLRDAAKFHRTRATELRVIANEDERTAKEREGQAHLLETYAAFFERHAQVHKAHAQKLQGEDKAEQLRLASECESLMQSYRAWARERFEVVRILQKHVKEFRDTAQKEEQLAAREEAAARASDAL
jgi:hypothetical protein